MKKFSHILVFVLIACAVFSAQAYAETFQEAFVLFEPLFEKGFSPWTLTNDQTVQFANMFVGFKCRGLRTSLGTEKYYCASERKAFRGNYVMVFDFGYGKTLLAAEIQISHPDLDDYLQNGMKYSAWLSVAEDTVKNFEGLTGSSHPDVKNPCNHIFYDLDTIPYSNLLFSENVMFSTGFREKGKSGTNTLVLVFSQPSWFWSNQIVYSQNPETGEIEANRIAH